MATLGIRLRDVPATIGWDGLSLLVRHLPVGCATWRALNPGMERWSSTTMTNVILADVFDAVMEVAYATAQAHSRTRVPKPRPYPRPWADAPPGERSVGSGAIPSNEFHAWYYGSD